MRILPIIAMALLLSGCGSIISRTVPGQGHGNQYYPGVQWDVRDSAWRSHHSRPAVLAGI